MAEFTEVLNSWAEIFMRRSMHDFMRFGRGAGLSLTQISVLFHLRYGNRCGVSEIGERLGVSNAAASQLVDRLEHMGLLERLEDPDDRRLRHLSLTPKGTALVAESVLARGRWMERLTSNLSAEQQQAIAAALLTLTQAVVRLENESKPA
jgi:DNA-binding MarR family transcriptional regulator